MCGESPRCFGTNLETSTWQVEKKHPKTSQNIDTNTYKYTIYHHIIDPVRSASPLPRPWSLRVTPRPCRYWMNCRALPRNVWRPPPKRRDRCCTWGQAPDGCLGKQFGYWLILDSLDFTGFQDLRNLGSWKHNPHMRSYMRSLSCLGAWHAHFCLSSWVTRVTRENLQ